VRIFDNPILERISHVHPVTPLLLWTPVVAWLSWRSFAVHRLESGTAIALGAAGLFVWTLTEYLVHRFAFHLAPTSRGRRRVQFIIHGIHHADPDDRTRLVMPPAPAIAASAALYGLFRAVLGPAWVEPFFACFIAGYLAYDYTHFAIHCRRPRTRVGRYLRRHHMLHHFVTPDARWGVSSPLWDWIFHSTGRLPRRPRRMAAAR
jgi:dihydroceramide fatty acyl 2-hydroxylase